MMAKHGEPEQGHENPWGCSPACVPKDALRLHPYHFDFTSKNQERSPNRRVFLTFSMSHLRLSLGLPIPCSKIR